MDTDSLADLALAQAALERVRVRLTAAAPAVTIVRAGDGLQALIDLHGGPLQLEAGTWTGTYTLRSGTQLAGRPGSAIRGITGPALIIPPGTRGVSVSMLEVTSAAAEVITIGENSDRQTTAAQMPTDIAFTDVTTPTHRGKRIYAIHGAVTLTRCIGVDCYDPAGQDSQAIYIGNTTVFPTIIGGRYCAGSNTLLSGGDVMRIPGVVPRNGLVDGVEFSRPLSWKTDGVQRKVKAPFELKNAGDVVVRNCIIRGSWQDGQDGWAVMLTPALDGERLPPPDSGDVRNILFEDCTIADVAGGFSIMGRHYQAVTPNALTGIVVRRVSLVASMAKFGGNRGNLALIQGEPGTIAFENVTAITDGPALVYYESGTVLDPVTRAKRPGGKIGSLSMIGSRGNLGPWGFMLNGNINAHDWPVSVGALTVDGNTFGGGVMPSNVGLTNNTYQAAPFTA